MNRRRFVVAGVVAGTSVLAGCRMFGGGQKKHRYPADLKAECERLHGKVRTDLKAAGASLKRDGSLVVTKVPGEICINGQWAWADPRWPNIWIGGLCGGNYIKIACNPETGGEIHGGSLYHEFGHYWLANNGYGLRHVPRFKGVFGGGWDDGLLQSIHDEFIAVDGIGVRGED